MRRPQVRFSVAAAERMAAFHRRRQEMLRLEIQRVAASGPARGFVRVATALDIAACEVLENGGLMLVYAVVPRRELMRKLWGSEVDEKLRRREASRLTHGRWWD